MANFDDTTFPLVLSTWSIQVSGEEVQAYFRRLIEIAERAQREDTRYITISTGDTGITADLRRMISVEVDKIPEALTQRNLASFVIITNPVIRGTITALRWVSKRMENVYPVATFEEGVDRAMEAFAKARIKLPPRPRAMPDR